MVKSSLKKNSLKLYRMKLLFSIINTTVDLLKFNLFTTEKDVEVLVKDLEKKMKEAREKIKKELMKGQEAYGENLEQLHKFYVSTFIIIYTYIYNISFINRWLQRSLYEYMNNSISSL